RKRLGMTAIVDGDGRLLGLYTDGDLRRTLADPSVDVHAARIADVMTRSPVSIDADALASEAARVMEDRKITMLPVLDDARRVVGELSFLDLFRRLVVERPGLGIRDTGSERARPASLARHRKTRNTDKRQPHAEPGHPRRHRRPRREDPPGVL